MDPDHVYNRQPLDSWKRSLMKDMVQPSDEAFTTEAIASYDWKTGFPPSIRVQNILAIASVLQMSSHLQNQDPTGLIEADCTENQFYSVSSSGYDYIMRVSDHLQKIRRDTDIAKLGGEENIVPKWYYLTQPVSDKYFVVQTFDTISIQGEPIPQNKLLREERQPGDSRGPLRSLLERSENIRCCVEKLTSLLLSKFKIPNDMQRLTELKDIVTVPLCPMGKITNGLSTIPLKTSCYALLKSINMVATELNELVKQPQGIEMKMKYLEELYASTVMLSLKKFVKDVEDMDLGKISYRKQFMSIKGPELLQHVMMEHGRQITYQLGEYYKEMLDALDAGLI